MDRKMRLDKFLAEMGAATRSQAKDMARRGRIQVNGVTAKKADEKIDPTRDIVVCDGVRVAYAEYEYYMLNKPQGVVSATEDPVHGTVLDLILKNPPKDGKSGAQPPRRKDLFPVGRLDIDTEGLLLITNDGDLAHQLLSPRRHVDKRYFARVEGMLPKDAARRFQEGITLLDGTKVMPALLETGPVLPAGTGETVREITLTIREGKFHQVKRMFEAVGCRVVFLKRLSMGSLRLDESLRPGEYRPLLEEELEGLKGIG